MLKNLIIKNNRYSQPNTNEEEIPMKIKKILAAILAATMVMASALTVCAADGSNGSNGSNGQSSSSSTTAGSSTTNDDTITVAPENVLGANSQISIAGTKVKTTIAGAYMAKNIQGAAVTTSLEDIKAALGLTGNQKPYIIMYDTDTKKSVKAMASIQAALEANGGVFVTALNIDLGAKENGKFVKLADGSVNMLIGLPKTCDTTKEYCIILVQPGGIVSLLEDKDIDPKTITFDVKAGLGTYALVQK